MPDWRIERGIGEVRAVLIEHGEIVEARILLDGAVRAGSVIAARLISAGALGRNAVGRSEDGREYLLPGGARGHCEGETLRIEVRREIIPGSEPWKRPLGRITDQPFGEAEAIAGAKIAFPAPTDTLDEFGWDALIDDARSGLVTFPGGELAIEPTRAMTMIDVDGSASPDELAQLGALAAARAIRRLDIQGSIGIDLLTTAGKDARQAAAAAIDSVLPRPFERTAVNGFGFVQIVRPRLRASLIELAADRAPFEARALLRRAAFEPPGAKTLVAHPKVISVIEAHPGWIDALAMQLGGAVSLRADASLAIAGGHAQRA